MPDISSVATDELLQVLFYKIYTTPRRYGSNVRLIFHLKNLLALDDDRFRSLCEELDETRLREAIPEVMKRSLDSLEKELAAPLSGSPEFARLDGRAAGELSAPERRDLALLYLDAGVMPRAIALLEEAVADAPRDGEAWLLLTESRLIASDLDGAETACRAALATPDLPEPARATLAERLAALRLEAADELYVREVFAGPHLARARAHHEAERFVDAARAAEHAARIMPGGYEALLEAGCAWRRAGDSERAERCFEQSLVIMEMPILVSNF